MLGDSEQQNELERKADEALGLSQLPEKPPSAASGAPEAAPTELELLKNGVDAARNEYVRDYNQLRKKSAEMYPVRSRLGLKNYRPTSAEEIELASYKEDYDAAVEKLARYTHQTTGGDSVAKAKALVELIKADREAFESATKIERSQKFLETLKKITENYSKMPKLAKAALTGSLVTGALAVGGVGLVGAVGWGIYKGGKSFLFSKAVAPYMMAAGAYVALGVSRAAERDKERNISGHTEGLKTFDPSSFEAFKQQINKEFDNLKRNKKFAYGLGAVIGVTGMVAAGGGFNSLEHLSGIHGLLGIGVAEPVQAADTPVNPLAESAPNAPEGISVNLSGDYEIKRGNDVIPILKHQLDNGQTFHELSAHQKDVVIANMLRGFSPEEIKSVGIESGNFDLIHPGEHINLDKLVELAQNKGHSIDSLIAHAQTFPASAEHVTSAPHAHGILETKETTGVPQSPQIEPLTPDSIINFNGQSLPLHEAAGAMMAGNLAQVLGPGLTTEEHMAALGRAFVDKVPNANSGDFAQFGLPSAESLDALRQQIAMIGRIAKHADSSFQISPPGVVSAETIRDFLIRANTTILEHGAERAAGS